MKIKILIAEDHDFTRQSLVYGFKKYKNVERIAEATNGQEAIDFAKKYSPDIILMDIGMPIIDGILATREIKAFNEKIKVLMFTSNKEKDKVLLAFKSGADAYCTKSIKIEALINVIESVVSGIVWIDSEIASCVLDILQMGELKMQEYPNTDIPQKVDYNLTTREKEILKLISEGMSNKDISEKLVLSLYTVKNHVSNVIRKLYVDDRTQAAVIALKDSII